MSRCIRHLVHIEIAGFPLHYGIQGVTPPSPALQPSYPISLADHVTVLILG